MPRTHKLKPVNQRARIGAQRRLSNAVHLERQLESFRKKIRKIAKDAGIKPAPRLVSTIEGIADEYRNYKCREATDATAALRSIREARVKLKAAKRLILESGETGTLALMDVYLLGLSLPCEQMYDDLAALERLTEALLCAGSRIPICRGTMSEWVRNWLFAELARIYGQYSGLRFTYPDKRQKFRGSDFVSSIAKAIDSTLTESALRNGLAFASRRLANER
jgi:hypothetical protein